MIRKLCALLLVCVLSMCLFVACGPAEPQQGTDETTTTLGDATATTEPAASSNDPTSSQTVKPSGSNQPSQNGTNPPQQSPDPQGAATVSAISVGGTALSEFNAKTKNYTYYLPSGTTAAPQITATKTAGTGEISITQAGNVNSAAKVTLNGTTYTIQFVVRRSEMDMLNNTYYQLKTAKKLNVAYLGGSVTDGFGATNSNTKSWRALTTAWLKSQYSSASITETNAGIGGTGTIYGAHRVIQDLKLTNASAKPDLVFIEFSANDLYDAKVNTTPGAYMESIIKTIYKYAPQADIVMVFITDFDSKDKDYTTKVAHKKVADAYQIPTIDVGARIWKDIVKEKGSAPASVNDATWKKYFKDIVHATDAGYAKYAQYVQEYLKGVFGKKTAVPSARINAYAPAKTVNASLPVAPYIANFKGLTPAATSKIKVSSEGYITSSEIDATFTFKFTGTDLRFWIFGKSTSEAQAGQIQVWVDGKRQKINITGDNHKILPIATGLANTEHTVKVVLAPTSAGGKVNLDLRHFLISGDTSMRGITLA